MKNDKISPKAMAGDIPVYCSHDEIVNIMKVVPNPKNPNMHPERQIEILSQVIKAQGWRKPITVSKRSGFVVSGHGRLQAAILLKLSEVPVDYQDYATEAEEYADLVADNRIAELSDVNEDLLIDILNEINDTDIDVLLTGYDYHEIDDLINDDEALAFIDTLTESKPKKQDEHPTSTSDPEPQEDETSEPTSETKNSPVSEKDLSDNVKDIFEVIVQCENETHQQQVFNSLVKDGYTCRVLTL